MRELVRLIEEPRGCSYLPEQAASLEYRVLQSLSADEYEELLTRGYRRFGRQLFRPQCPGCEQCVSVRVLPQQFAPNRGQRRVLRKNAHLRVERAPVAISDERLKLYNRYHGYMAEHRGWRRDAITEADYHDSFVAGGSGIAYEWLYYDADRLMGVALMDETPRAISLVYFYYEPEWRPLSPGVFSVLVQLEYAREAGKTHAYPGYWIPANRSMAYKGAFRPFERLERQPADHVSPRWMLDEPGAPDGAVARRTSSPKRSAGTPGVGARAAVQPR